MTKDVISFEKVSAVENWSWLLDGTDKKTLAEIQSGLATNVKSALLKKTSSNRLNNAASSSGSEKRALLAADVDALFK